MVKTQFLRDDENYLIFSEIYLRFSDPGAKRTAFAILEAAVTCINKKGFGQITMEMIAKETGTPRSSIRHYFSSVDEISETAIKYIRLRFQKFVLESVSQETSPTSKLAVYIQSCFEWIESSRTHANVWLSFLSQCARKPSLRALNTAAVVVGDERIQSLLLAGKSLSQFHFDSASETGKAIQSLITGAMVTYGSEDLADPSSYRKSIEKQCLMLSGVQRATS